MCPMACGRTQVHSRAEKKADDVPLSIQMMAKEKVIFQKSKTVNPCATGTCAHTHACLICIVALLLITHAITNTT